MTRCWRNDIRRSHWHRSESAALYSFEYLFDVRSLHVHETEMKIPKEKTFIFRNGTSCYSVNEQKIAGLCFEPILCSVFPSVRSVSFLFLSCRDRTMDSSNVIIPFDFPFAILGKRSPRLVHLPPTCTCPLENRHNPDPDNKLVYAVADGQFTYGPLSYYQYQNDEKYAKT